MKTCPVCKKVLTDQAKFCFFCGASLLNTEEEPIISAAKSEQEPVPAEETVPAEPIQIEETVPVEPVQEAEPLPVEPAQETTAQESAPVEKEPVAEPEPIFIPTPAPQPKPEPQTPVEAKPEQPIVLASDSRSLMTTVGYIFTTILFHIPLIGLIFMIAWGCGKTKNLSRKRFSLACLILRLLFYILILSVTVFLLICFSGKIPALWDAVKPILAP